MSKFADLINTSEIPVLVDFYADWCGPCKMLEPTIKEFSGEMAGKVKVIKVDVDRNQAAAQKYGIMGVPTLILFHKGKIIWRESGIVPKNMLMEIVNDYSAKQAV